MGINSVAAKMIDIVLPSQDCAMILPRYEYKEKKNEEFGKEKVERKKENLILLEDTISQVMVKNHTLQLAETLTDIKPIIYLDCSAKGERDIMHFMMDKVIERHASADTDNIIKSVIKSASMIDDTVRKDIAGK